TELLDSQTSKEVRQALEILWIWRRADVDVLGRTNDAPCIDREAPDENVLDPGLMELAQKRANVQPSIHRRPADSPSASSNAARINASACSRFSPRPRLASLRSISTRAASFDAASSRRRSSALTSGSSIGE